MNTYLSYGAAYNDHLDSTGNEARQEAYDVLKKDRGHSILNLFYQEYFV